MKFEVSRQARGLLAGIAPTQPQVSDARSGSLGRDELLRLVDTIERLLTISDRPMQLQAQLANGRTEPGPGRTS